MMPLASIIEEQFMLDELRKFADGYNKNIVSERGMLLEAQVLQAIVDLAAANHSNTNPSMKEIAQKYNSGRTDKEHITSHKVGRVVGDRLKLEKFNKRGVFHLVWDFPKVRRLCERYGVILDSVDFGGFVDFDDSLGEPPGKSTQDQNRSFPGSLHEKSSKSSSPHKLTPATCGDCSNYSVKRGWIGCKKADQKLKNMDSCPLEAG